MDTCLRGGGVAILGAVFLSTGVAVNEEIDKKALTPQDYLEIKVWNDLALSGIALAVGCYFIGDKLHQEQLEEEKTYYLERIASRLEERIL